MKEVKFFVCEHCNTQYKDKAKASSCEKAHKLPLSIEKATYHANGTYPDKVEIKFTDGKRILYKI